MQITFSVNGEEQLSRNLRVLVSDLWDMQSFFEETLKIVEKRTDDIFKGKWANVAKWPKWKKLSPATIKARDKRRWYYKQTPNNPSLLRRTWNMQESRRTEFWKDYWLLVFDAPYADYHQEWWRNLPKRAIIDLSNDTNTKIVKAMQQKIQDTVKIFGLQT